MRVGSLVEYVGGQCDKGITIFRLEKNTPHVISQLGIEVLGSDYIWVKLSEAVDIIFIISMFSEIQPPMNIEIDKLIEEAIGT